MKRTLLLSGKYHRLLIGTALLLLNAAAWATDYPGYLKVEMFDSINGGNVSDLTGAAKYTNNQPDAITFVSSLYFSRNPGQDNYGDRISGYLIPAESADYVFFVAADDSASFYLSTDSSPVNLKLIAADQGWQDTRAWTGLGSASSGGGTTNVVFRRGFNPGPTVLETNDFQWVGPFQNRSDQFLHSPLTNLLGSGQAWPKTDANGNAVITLTANQKYYFQLLHKEGSGGEHAEVAWKKASDPDPDNGAANSEIQGEFLSVTYTNVLTFMKQPQSQSVSLNQPVTFTVEVVGVPGDSDTTQFTYEWRNNGQAITGAASLPSYTLNAPALSDSGHKFSVKVTTAGGLTATSADATLTVSNDNTPPTIEAIQPSDSFDSIKVIFSEAVRNEAADPANYKLSGGLTISDANFYISVLDTANPEDPKNPYSPTNRVAVVLLTSKQTPGTSYDLTISNVKDITGNALTPNTGKVYANVFKSGVLNYKRWMGGNNLPNLKDDAVRYASPTVKETRTIAQTGGEGNTYVAGTYLDLVDGFFIAPATTNYTFFISADNDGYLYLSSDADPVNKKLVAADVGWQNTATWTGPGGDTAKRRGDGTGGGPFENRSDEFLTSQRALNGGPPSWFSGLIPADGVDPDPWPKVDSNGNAVISLTAGQRYYFQLWHAEGDSGRAEITYKYSGENDPTNGTASRITGSLMGAYIDASSEPPTITNQPSNVNFTPGQTITFKVGVDSVLPPTMQWYKNQGALSGQTSSTLSIANATAADIGSYYLAVTNLNGSVNSSPAAALTPVAAPGIAFQQDASGMTVMEAEHYYAATAAPDGHVWVPVTGRAGNSGTGAMSALPDSNVNLGNSGYVTNGARLDFKITFKSAGTNYIWLRGGDAFGAGNGDSVHAGLDGVSPASATRIDGTPGFTIATGWNWVGNIQGDTRAYVEVPSAGDHTFNLWMREDGFTVDKIILTTDPNYTPTDLGPAESQSSGGGEKPTLSISSDSTGELTLTYTGTLVSALDVKGPYKPVTGASGGTYKPNTQSAVRQFYQATK